MTASVVNPRLTKVAYDPFKDFDPIALPATTTQVLVVHPSLPVRTVTELVALVRANPGQYSYGSAGIGSASHLTAELFRTSLGLDLIHIPFNGAGPAIASTLGGHTPIAFGSPASTVAQVNEGSPRGLAVASRIRLTALQQDFGRTFATANNAVNVRWNRDWIRKLTTPCSATQRGNNRDKNFTRAN